MPTYSYVCTECAHDFDTVQAITDATLTTCPQCGGVLRKVFHPVGVAFKGSGFYRTDSRAGSGKDGKESSDGAKPAAAKTEQGSDSGSKSDSDSGSGKDSGSSKSTSDKSKGDSGSSGSGSSSALAKSAPATSSSSPSSK